MGENETIRPQMTDKHDIPNDSVIVSSHGLVLGRFLFLMVIFPVFLSCFNYLANAGGTHTFFSYYKTTPKKLFTS